MKKKTVTCKEYSYFNDYQLKPVMIAGIMPKSIFGTELIRQFENQKKTQDIQKIQFISEDDDINNLEDWDRIKDTYFLPSFQHIKAFKSPVTRIKKQYYNSINKMHLNQSQPFGITESQENSQNQEKQILYHNFLDNTSNHQQRQKHYVRTLQFTPEYKFPLHPQLPKTYQKNQQYSQITRGRLQSNIKAKSESQSIKQFRILNKSAQIGRKKSIESEFEIQVNRLH